jgi:hypothetical protein
MSKAREEKLLLSRFHIVWSGALPPADGRTKGELLPQYERKPLAVGTLPRVFPRKYKSAE